MRSLARAALGSFRLAVRLRVVSPWSYLNWLVFPLLFAAVGLYVLGGRGATSSHLVYGVLGGGLIGYWSVAYIDAGNGIQDERWNGTLEQIFATPTPLVVILLGKVLAGLAFGLLSFLPTAALAYFGFHAVLPDLDPWPFVISLAVLTFSFFCIAITLAPLFALWRWAFSMLNGFELGVYVLCGFMFPVAVLASWAQGVAGALAPTWAVRALYASTLSGGPHDYALWWGAVAGLSLAYLVGAYFLYALVEREARVSGELALA
ncbi:MAG TPA: ABC transporter permease [Candidatus Dormibacteraeota bacterium]|nr:ABC transporter permease [Candidatus Dormibacteraeota bacterium]